MIVPARCRGFALAILVGIAAGCATIVPPKTEPSPGHLDKSAAPAPAAPIPDVVAQSSYLPPPEPVKEGERYTVVVNDVPVRELLFALARDAKLNVDIKGEIAGKVTLNAIDQTLQQILERVARQVELRYTLEGDTIVVTPDSPYLRSYEVGYVNLSRDVDTKVNVATRVATTGESNAESSGGSSGSSSSSTGAGSNSSSTALNSKSYNRFWQTLTENIIAILGEGKGGAARGEKGLSDNVIVNAEAGVLSVKATSKQHQQIQEYIDRVLVNARRQVMIEATIVEVTLSDQFQAGVDWSMLLNAGKAGFTFNQKMLGAITDGVIDNNISSFVLGYSDPDASGKALSATLRLLREFGDTRVLSSPRLMVLNNQTAVLKVVEELVYFTVDVTDKDATQNAQGRTFIQSQVHSVPVGLVMAVTPQISQNKEVTLTVRPTISQKIGDAVDPGVQLAGQVLGGNASQITSTVPVIRVREMESVLKLVNGQIGVLGGLMQDDLRGGHREVPGLAKLPIIGNAFFHTREANNQKTELVVFLRPVVVTDPNVDTDLKDYRQYLGQGPGAQAQ
ncbi:MAG: secretin N-terminal domain-containing protein [Gammaproteobacteria bacterium]|nr:secretin N-terminal domain-containing protein [Gammaproteobacteria bacterium]MBI5617558.1 secretin N-terminal domain-containing protein [Gammaproteobacteria bacterium]